MDLKEWASLSAEQQRALVVERAKKKRWRALYRKFANQAAKSLKDCLNGNRHVTDVHYVIGEFYNHDPIFWAAEFILNVCTKDSDPPRLDLPNRHAGFRVCQFDYGPRRDAYLRTWKRLFKELKGWSEEQTLSWVARYNYIDALEGGVLATVVYSHGPISSAVHGLVSPHDFQDRRINVYNEIRGMIWDTARRCGPYITNEKVHHPDTIENYDWEFVRNRLKEIIETYQRPSSA